MQSRLAALSRAHELILPRGGETAQSVELKSLVELVLAPYRYNDERLEISGPSVECGHTIATSLALVLHEFATNSVKYGALSNHVGRVRISWEQTAETLTLTWLEETSTAYSEKTDAGFGSVLADAAARGMGAELTRVWSDRGLSIVIAIPTNRVL